MPASEAAMTSATTEPSRRTGGRHAEGHGYGLVVCASVLLIIGGIGLAGLASLGRENQARALARAAAWGKARTLS
jgi:hypothetical protein